MAQDADSKAHTGEIRCARISIEAATVVFSRSCEAEFFAGKPMLETGYRPRLHSRNAQRSGIDLLCFNISTPSLCTVSCAAIVITIMKLTCSQTVMLFTSSISFVLCKNITLRRAHYTTS